jgi:hypothetical protein
MESLLKHYIGVFDPESGKLKIIEAKKMVVRGVVRSRQAEDEAMAEQTVRHVCALDWILHFTKLANLFTEPLRDED